jgi:hypothetical protein
VKYFPDRWKVENAMLYLRINGTWVLQKYKIVRGMQNNPTNLYLFTMPFKGLPVDSYFDLYNGNE